MHLLLWILFLIWLVSELGGKKFLPWLNRNFFSRIWSEESRPVIAREAIDRIKELCIDGDVPEETAVLMAARENDLTEEEFLSAFSATDAKELVSILSNKKPAFGAMLLKRLTQMDRAGMRRK